MKSDTKKRIVPIVLLIVYILLATLGVYQFIGFLLSTLLSIPLAIYIIKSKESAYFHITYNIIAVIGVGLMSRSIDGTLIYLISVTTLAYIFLFLYKEQFPLPNIIVYGTLLISVMMFIYMGAMKVLGVNYEAQFISILEEMKHIFLPILKENFSAAGINDIETQNQLIQSFIAVIDMMKQIYPAFMVLSTLSLITVSTLILNVVLRIKNKFIPSARQLLEFRVSKIVIAILFVAMLIVGFESNVNSTLMIVAVNLVVILNMLLSLVGGLALLGIVRKSTMHTGLKVICYIVVVVIFTTWPTILMLFGSLDTLFNYRKVNIIV